MRLAEIIPKVTDRIILPIGTVEPHGACAIGTDNVIPQNLAGMIWERCNALIAPSINHGFTGASIFRFPGAITVRPEVFEEYIYDVLKDLVRTGFRNVLIINGHGGNTDPARKAITRLHQETGAHFMLVDREMYEKLGKDNVGKTRTEAGVVLMPAWSTSMYPEKGVGYLDFDVAKAKEYATKKANYIAETFLEAVRRWEMMESWKK